MIAGKRLCMHRKLACALLAAALLPMLSFSVLAAPEGQLSAVSPAADMDYSGPLDPMTGLPAGSHLNGDDPDHVTLREKAYSYDLAQRCYVNEVGSLSFTSSIPNGALLNTGAQTVSFTIPSGLSAVLYRNGNVVSDADLANITDAGNYLLEVSAGGSGQSVSFAFRLLGELTNTVTELSLPSGFSFSSLRLDGEELTPEYSNYTQLLVDGKYEVVWACPEIDRHYTVEFTLDTRAPVLALPEVVDGQAHSAVTLTDLEPGAYILLTDKKTGQTTTIVYADAQIAEAGVYHLAVYDRAGNYTEYDFTIHVYLNISALAAIALALAGVLSLWGYSRYIRRNPRVG